MGSFQSQITTAPASEAQIKLRTPLPPPASVFPTPTLPGGLEEFEYFPKLPPELQVKIWTHALEPDSIKPRVVRVIYKVETSTYNYSFTIPPLLTTCRRSRHVAQQSYRSLVPNLPHSVYFNTAVDFLYCTSTHDWSQIPDQQEIDPILSFLDESSILADICFLLFDKSFWCHSYMSNSPNTSFAGSGRIPQLRYFTSLKELFLVDLPLEEDFMEYRRRFMAIVADPDSRLGILETRRVARIAHDATMLPSIVPGFRNCEESQIDFIRRWEIEGCFGTASLPFFGKSGTGWRNDAYMDKDLFGNQRNVLRCTEIRPCSRVAGS